MRWGGLQVTAVGKCILECIYMTLYTWGTLGRDDSHTHIVNWDIALNANYNIQAFFGLVPLSCTISQARVESPFIDRECISAKV